ncbi:MAG: hypothetical protein AB1489_14455 [Acidobacteriota bacterium]
MYRCCISLFRLILLALIGVTKIEKRGESLPNAKGLAINGKPHIGSHTNPNFQIIYRNR